MVGRGVISFWGNFGLFSGEISDFTEGTWRIIPVSKCLVTPISKPILGHLEGDHPSSISKDTRALQATRGPSRQIFRTIFRTLREDAETPHQEVTYVDPTKVDVQKNWFCKPHLKFYELMIWWMMFHVQDLSSKMSSTKIRKIPPKKKSRKESYPVQHMKKLNPLALQQIKIQKIQHCV